MAMSRFAFLAVLVVLLLQASPRAVARRHHHDPDPDPCRDDGSLLRHRDHRCSSPSHGGTRATMTVNRFGKGEDGGGGGGGAAACDGRFGGKRCHKLIRITSTRTGRSVVAKVVVECDSRQGCRDNIVDTSKAVWDALGLDTNIGEVPVTWSDA